MANTGFTSVPDTTNYLKENAFSFQIAYLPNTVFHLQSANLPAISASPISVATPLSPLSIPANTLEYEQLILTFRVDENLANYREIHEWMIKLHSAKSTDDFATIAADPDLSTTFGGGVTDGTLSIRTNKQNANVRVIFKDIFPVALTGIQFTSATDAATELVSSVTMAYNTYEIVKL